MHIQDRQRGIEILEVKRLEQLKSIETDGRTLRLAVSDLTTAQREIPAAIAAAGVALRRFEIEETSLEDVFVELVGGPGGSGGPVQ